jgi:hypothetical protein
MRILVVILFSVIIGTALGGAAALMDVRRDGDVVAPQLADSPSSPVAKERPAARVEIAAPEFNFGAMQRGTKRSHEFIVKNAGNAPLTLRVGETTCKCTLGVASEEPIQPGESTNVKLEWTAIADPGPFRQTATLLTNDPRHSRLVLTIAGQVNEAKGIEPPDFLLDKISAGESKSAQVFLMAMFHDEISVSDWQLTNADLRPYFDVQIEPVERAELPNPAAKAGVRITVTAKPGMPLGNFYQGLKLHTTLADAPEIDIPIIGRVVGDISVHGNEWDDERGILQLGHVKSGEGKRVRLNVVIRGAGAENVTLSVASRDPPALSVSIGEPKRLRESLVHVPVEVEVPPGTPPMVRLGTAQGEQGRVVLGSTHPTVREVSLDVRFSVER